MSTAVFTCLVHGAYAISNAHLFNYNCNDSDQLGFNLQSRDWYTILDKIGLSRDWPKPIPSLLACAFDDERGTKGDYTFNAVELRMKNQLLPLHLVRKHLRTYLDTCDAPPCPLTEKEFDTQTYPINDRTREWDLHQQILYVEALIDRACGSKTSLTHLGWLNEGELDAGISTGTGSPSLWRRGRCGHLRSCWVQSSSGA